LPETKSVVIGTGGHIDHGKTALVRALTGIDTDRLPEEKRRGITIDLGFASLDERTVEGQPLQMSFVDVPGHNLFIRNMLAGAGGIDCLMLVVSAVEGIKPQTEEHLAICALLGITHGLTVLTKADSVHEIRLAEVLQSTRRFLTGSFLSPERSPVVVASARTGQGLPEVRSKLIECAIRIPVRNPNTLVRLPLDRAFAMKGFGAVVTGTLQSGTILPGQTFSIEPGSKKVRVRGLQIHGRSEARAHAGSRVALNLAGVEASDVKRGDTLVESSTFEPVAIIDVEATILAGAPALKHRSIVRFHAFTSDVAATVSLIQAKSLEAGQTGIVRLKLGHGVVLAPGDRFVLRQCSPAITIGGGRVLDTHPLSGLFKAKRLDWLEQLKKSSIEEQLFLRIARRDKTGLLAEALVRETGMPRGAVDALAKSLAVKQMIVDVSGSLYLTTSAFAAASKDVLGKVGQAGLKRAELKQRAALEDDLFAFLIEKLTREQRLRVEGDLICPFSSRPQISAADAKKLATIADAYAAAGLAVPPPQEVAERLRISQPEMRRLITLLLRDKTLIKVGAGDLFVHRQVLSALQTRLRALSGQTMDVAAFKILTGLSRKYAIPLLEHLDSLHITRKHGESRLIL
jgi:selenocysteine-specific elongation factor